MNETEALIQRLMNIWKTAEARRDRVTAARAKQELLTAYDVDRKQQEARAKRSTPWENQQRAANELRENWRRLGEVVGNPIFEDSIIPLETDKKAGDMIRYEVPPPRQFPPPQQSYLGTAQYQPADADTIAFGGSTKYWSQADRDAWFSAEGNSIVNNKPAPEEETLPAVVDRSKFVRRIKLD